MSANDAPRHFTTCEQHLADIVAAALQAADPARCVRRALQLSGSLLRLPDREIDLGAGRVYLVSTGKAAQAMAGAAVACLGDRLAGGVVIAKDTADPLAIPMPPNISLHLAGHPVADDAGIAATREVAHLLAKTQVEDVVLCLISGGTSALLTDPRLPLAQWQMLTGALLESGCDIAALNTVRRRLDSVKGGGLARWAAPARCVSLILSDVVGNQLAAIGSGPTVPDDDPPDAALQVLARHHLAARLPAADWEALLAAVGAPPEPLAVSPPVNYVVGDVVLAAQAAANRAAALGFDTRLLTTTLEGEARDAGVAAAVAARGAPAGTCLIWAGETTVTVRGAGRGGRNQECVLAAVAELDRAQQPAGAPRLVLASVATDGEDRIAGIGGAWATDETAAAARRLELDPNAFLADNDSYGFFSRLSAGAGSGGLLPMPPSGTNVNDLLLVLTYSPE